jgi:hypothetical protein
MVAYAVARPPVQRYSSVPQGVIMDEEDLQELREWVNNPPLMTREAVLAELHERGYQISERQLRSWVTYGILPRPIRRVPKGATDGVARALYPVWMVDVIAYLVHEMARGVSREKLKFMAPTVIQALELTYKMEQIGSRTTPDTFDAVWDQVIDDDVVSALDYLPAPPPPRIPRALQRAVQDYAERVALASGTPITHITLDLMDADGKKTTIALPAPSDVVMTDT